MRLCVISSDIKGNPVHAALSSIEEDNNISSIMCLAEDNIANDCKSWINNKKDKSTKVVVCEEPNWQKYGKRAIYIRESFVIENSDVVMIIWSGKDKVLHSFMQRCQREGVNVHEVIIKINSNTSSMMKTSGQSLVSLVSEDDKTDKGHFPFKLFG